MKVQYIGRFPPPYGGVTQKNKLIYDCLQERIQIERISVNKIPAKIEQLINLLWILRRNRKSIIGISSSRGKSKLFTLLFYLINRKCMKESIYFMMGGTEAKRIVSNRKEIKRYSNYKHIFVETKSMLEHMVNAGMENVSLFPNCRKKPEKEYVIHENYDEPLRCVFFSNVQKEKGVDIILEAAKELPSSYFDIYGTISLNYKKEFIQNIEQISNVRYCGIFRGEQEETYSLLNQYDILLLPTKYKNEGVPGVLIEGKVAGLAEIVSNQCYNSDIVKNGEEGIVMEYNNAERLTEVIRCLNHNRRLLYKLKLGSSNSAKKYYVDGYIEDIVNKLV